MTDLEHLDAEIARCQKFVDMLSGGKKSGGDTGTLERFTERRDALLRIRARIAPGGLLAAHEDVYEEWLAKTLEEAS